MLSHSATKMLARRGANLMSARFASAQASILNRDMGSNQWYAAPALPRSILSPLTGKRMPLPEQYAPHRLCTHITCALMAAGTSTCRVRRAPT